jgi:hypothetical protein
MPSLAEYGGEPSVCGASSIVTTQIIFAQHRGDRPPMFVTRNTSDTRAWPSGSTPLSLSSSTASAVLRFATRHELYCAVCPTCFGRVYFQYGTSVTDPIDVTTAGAAAALTSAIAALEVCLTESVYAVTVNVQRSVRWTHLFSALYGMTVDL